MNCWIFGSWDFYRVGKDGVLEMQRCTIWTLSGLGAIVARVHEDVYGCLETLQTFM